MKETFEVPKKKTILEDIRQGVADSEEFCNREGLAFKKPLLILGTFERVGSNWLLDTLNQHVHTHNEPFKQQLGEESLYSTLSPRLEDVDDSRSFKDPFAEYWMETFVNTKYGTVNHAVKETNLFFALQNFSKIFPDAPVLVLKRDPLGIFSSFVDQDLFQKWKYRERYDRLKRVTDSDRWGGFQFVFDGDQGTSPLAMLARMLFLNTLLLADTLKSRPYKELAYEASVKDRAEVLRFLSTQVFPGMHFSDAPSDVIDGQIASQGTFSTHRKKSTLESYLNQDDARTVVSEFERLFAIAGKRFHPSTLATARRFLNTDNPQYTLVGRRNHNAINNSVESPDKPMPEEFIVDTHADIEWRNKLVTNDEYCAFLNELSESGIFNLLDGGQVFFNENMIHERGGRIHFDQVTQKYRVSQGYENHPVYWVTWIGATAFGLSKGLRLPTRDEIDHLVREADVVFSEINAGHKSDDVHPATLKNYTPGRIYDVVGNLAVWCSDGQTQRPNDPQPIIRYIYGTAWNRPATLQEITKEHARPLVGNSRSVGIRLVKDNSIAPITPPVLITRLQNISPTLRGMSDASLRERDDAIIKLLSI